MATDRDPQRLLVTGDLHFGLYPESDVCTAQLAEFVCASEADAFAIAGDVADVDTESFGACLRLFAGFEGLKLLVPGNHDLWSVGISSLDKYRRVLPAIAAKHGFTMLDVAPAMLGRTGFIGNIGWYDYSLRSPQLQLSDEQYASKRLPGVCTWNDVRFISWDLTDAAFTEKCVRKLRSAYRTIEPRVHTVVAVLHHLPFSALTYDTSTAAEEFCRAFLGSERFGRLLLDCPKVRYVFCGHRHSHATHQVSKLEAICVGSDYRFKRLIDLDLQSGKHQTREFAVSPDKEATA